MGMLAIGFCLIFPHLGQAADKYKDWLKEVDLIILKEEKKQFKDLKDESEKDKFIAIFWAKRDPTPRTKKNEFKEEYYRRLDYIEEAFYYGYNKGLATDMGKVYLFFGQPLRTIRDDPRVEVWIYPSQPWMNLPKSTFTIVFTAVSTNYVDRAAQRARTTVTSQDVAGFSLNRQKTDAQVMDAFYAYPENMVRYPDLTEIPDYTETAGPSADPVISSLVQQAQADPDAALAIPFVQNSLFTKAENKSSYVSLLFAFQPEQMQGKKSVTFFGRLESETGSQDLKSEKKIESKQIDQIVQLGLPALPGEYELYLGFYSNDGKVHSLRKTRIEVPSFWNGDLSLSSLLASNQVQQVQPSPEAEQDFDVFHVGRYQLQPSVEHAFTKNDALNVFYYIYNITVDENQNCSLLFEFALEKSGERFGLNPQKRQKNLGDQRDILEGTQIPLSALPELGEYKLIITVKDEIAQKTASRSLTFTVRE
jgi:GWxTD domain-containing protein